MCASFCSHGDSLKLFKASQPYLKPPVNAPLIFYQRHTPPLFFLPAILGLSYASHRPKYSNARAVSKDTSHIKPLEVRGLGCRGVTGRVQRPGSFLKGGSLRSLFTARCTIQWADYTTKNIQDFMVFFLLLVSV